MRHKLRRVARICHDEGLVTATNRALRRLPIEVDNAFYRLQQDSPRKVMTEDWDTLLILDACQYDMFERRCDLDGDLQRRVSLGSTSEEFLRRNFEGDTFHDTVYINTNPYLPYCGLDEGTFHAVVDLLDEWDEDLQTVRPETVVEAALDAHVEFPNKRLIVHFMQPHYPFIGEYGERIETRGWSPDREGPSPEGRSVWQLLRDQSSTDPLLDEDLVRAAYDENLDIVLDAVAGLLPELDGRSVVTADHGNLIGERLFPIPTRRQYGHPYGVYHPNLVTVPWFVVEGDTRRTVTSDPPRRRASPDDAVTQERLAALGYAERT